MYSGPTFFDNSKAGKSAPTTRKRLRSPRGMRVWITYKFCSSMLSSAVDYKASSVKHLRICGIDSPRPGQPDRGIMGRQETGRTRQAKAAV